jgi:hypothetical protein
MRAIAVLGFILCMLAPVCSSGADAPAIDQWKYIGSNEKGERFFYDSESVIHVSMELRQVWIKELSNEPERRLVEINCSFKIIRDRQVISEGKRRTPRRPVRLPSEWRAMEKDPIEKELHKVLCR